jgi:cytidylate kinase
MTSQPKLIGLSGTNGSGKDSVGQILAEHYNYWFFGFTELFREECQRRGIPAERENLRMISAQWRRESGMATLIDRSLDLYKKIDGQYDGVVISSLRNPYEADRIHELGGIVLWVDADPKIRYERVQANAASRGRAQEDNKTFDQFMQEEASEMHAPAGSDKAVISMASVKERADIFLTNNDSGLDTLQNTLAKHLALPQQNSLATLL